MGTLSGVRFMGMLSGVPACFVLCACAMQFGSHHVADPWCSNRFPRLSKCGSARPKSDVALGVACDSREDT